MASTLLAMSLSMVLLVGVIKLVGLLSPDDMIKGGIAIAAFLGMITLMTLITKLGGQVKGLASTILAFSVAIGILAGGYTLA